MQKKPMPKTLTWIFFLILLLTTSCQDKKQIELIPTDQTTNVNIWVKFSEGTDIRLRDGELVSLSSGQIPGLVILFRENPIINIERAFSQSEEEIESERQLLIEEGDTDVPDLNLYFILTVQDQETATNLIQDLNQLAVVESAEFAPQPAPPPVENP